MIRHNKENVYSFSHKKHITNKNFYIFSILTAFFIAFFSFSFLLVQFVLKENMMILIINEFLLNENDKGFSSLPKETQDLLMKDASEILKFWSLPIYISAISGIIIFYIFILFGRSKLKYGYFFRTLWTIIFFGAAIGIFFTPYYLWMQIIIFFILISFGVVLIIELLKHESKREKLKAEIRQEWKNKRVHEEQNFILVNKDKNMKER